MMCWVSTCRAVWAHVFIPRSGGTRPHRFWELCLRVFLVELWYSSKQAPRCAWVRTSHGSWLMPVPKPLHLVVKAQVSSRAESFSAWLEVGEPPGHRSSSSSEGPGLIGSCVSMCLVEGEQDYHGRWLVFCWARGEMNPMHQRRLGLFWRASLWSHSRPSMVYKPSTIQFREL